jgi:YD repeat-containing protein
MKRYRIIASILTWLVLAVAPASALPVDLSAPTGGVGAAGLNGNLELWHEVGDAGLQLGPGSYLPLRYKFTSDSSVKGILGPGFYVPMFEAKNVLIREQMMRAFLPCGKGLYMRRDNIDPNKFQTLDQVWSGYSNGDDYTVWRDDGWKLIYHQGRLASITSDDKHTFTWSYDQTGLPTGVSRDGQSLVTVEPNIAGQVAAFIFNGKRYEVSYGQRPVTEMLQGQPVIKELVPALAGFKYPDGKSDAFKFTVSPDLVPTVEVTGSDGNQSQYTWDTATGHIATEKTPEGSWTYKVKEAIQAFGVPEIARIGTHNDIEDIAIDAKMGTYTRQMADGTKLVTHIFEAPGPLYQKVQSVENIANGQTTTVYRASYDEAGRLVRTTNEQGWTSAFSYDANGKIIKRIVTPGSDPASIAAIKQKEADLLSQIKAAVGPNDKSHLLEKLATLYVGQLKDPGKALSLLPLVTDPWDASEIEIMSISGNDNLTPPQKADGLRSLITKYPSQKDLLESMATHYQNAPY